MSRDTTLVTRNFEISWFDHTGKNHQINFKCDIQTARAMFEAIEAHTCNIEATLWEISVNSTKIDRCFHRK